MDVTINSQVQSPLVRTMETVSTKGTSFVHNIPDNIPPVSMNRVTVPFDFTPDRSIPVNSTLTIPAVGYLAKVVLDVTVSSTADDNKLCNYLAYEMVESVTLKTRNRTIETLDGAGMFGAISFGGTANSIAKALESVVHNGSEGYEGRTTNNQAAISDAAGYTDRRVRLTLPFSCCDDLSVAYNTRFVEPLSLTLKLKAVNVSMYEGTTAITYKSANATFHYVNYHDLTEQDIRAANFKPNLPAVTFGRDMMMESNSSIARGAEAAITIRSNNLCYAIAAWVGGDTTTAGCPMSKVFDIKKVRLVGSGQTMYEADGLCAAGNDAITQQLSTWSGRSAEGVALYCNNTLNGIDTEYIQASNAMADQTVVAALKPRQVAAIEFGLSRNTRYNSGAIGLQTLSNPTLYITAVGGTGVADATGDSTDGSTHMSAYVYVYYYSLVQIDSGTGAVTRSLDH